MKSFLSIAATLALLSAGCQSFSSTMLNRLDDNSFYGNSNGETKHHEKTRPFKGIPITLQVPSHLDIYIDEIYYMKVDEKANRAVTLVDDTRILDVRAEIKKTAKVFTVDFKRPGAGVLDLNLTFNEDQYFDSIVSELEDRTIKESGELVGQVMSSVKAFATSARGPNDAEKQLLEDRGIMRDRRVVAYQRFDINSVDFEYQVQEFVNQHLNACDQCSTSPTYDRPPNTQHAGKVSESASLTFPR